MPPWERTRNIPWKEAFGCVFPGCTASTLMSVGDRYKQVPVQSGRRSTLWFFTKLRPDIMYGIELQPCTFCSFASCFKWPDFAINWAALLQPASQSKWLAGTCRLLRSNHSCIDGRRKLTQASMCLVCLHSGADETHARSGFDSASYVLRDRKQTGHSLVFRFLSGLVPLFVG